MSGREKVFDDPLLAFMSSDSKGSNAPAAVVPAIPQQEETMRTINTDKVTLKSKVPKSAPAPAPVASVESIFDPTTISTNNNISGSKGLGFGVAVWENKLVASDVDVLATHNAGSSSAEGLFSNSVATHSKGDETAEYSRAKSGGRFKVAVEENDDQFGDLRVGNLVEREDTEADYDLFGKTKVVQGAKAAVVTNQVFAKARKDDFELDSSETIANLASATVERKAKPTSSSVFASPSFLEANDAGAGQDIDLSALDLNAYISQQSASQGGLFDD